MSVRSEVIRIMNEILADSKKISELPVGSAPAGTELIEAVQGGVNVSLTAAQFGGGSGATAFTQLTDVPASFTGAALQAVRVNAAETALEFFAISAGSVTSVTGTANRITSTGGATPVIDISAFYVGQSSITTLGTLTAGATGAGFTVALGTSTVTGALAVANGGTNLTSYTVGDLVYASAATTLSKLAAVAVGSYLGSKGVTTAPAWISLEYVTPEMYGAVGDGTTDDQAAIQNAVNSGKRVFFGAKSYLLSSTVSIPSNANITGSGSLSIIKTTTAIISFTITGTNAHISNLKFLGNQTTNQVAISAIGTGAVPVAPFVTGTRVDMCHFDSLYTGLYTLNSFNPTTYDGAYYVSNCVFTSNTNAGAELGLAGEYCVFSAGNVFYANNFGLYLIGGNQNVTGNKFNNNTAAIRIIGGSNNGKHDIVGNTINHNVTYSIWATSVSNGFYFRANNVFSSGQFYMQSCTDVQILGNTFSEGAASFSNLTCTNVNWVNNHWMTNTTVTITGTAPKFIGSTYSGTVPTAAPFLNTINANRTTIRGTTTSAGDGPFRVEDSASGLIMLARDDGRISVGNAGSASAISPFNVSTFSKTGASIGFECSGNAFGVISSSQSAAGATGAALIITGTNAPTSGSVTYGGVRIDHTLNQTASSTGDYAMFDDNTTLTAMIGNLYGVRIKQVTAKSGFGVTTPTAKVHLGAGATGASTAPLKFTSGTNMTTAEAGAMEYNGTNLFFTRAGTTRENVLVAVDNAAAPGTSVGIGIVNFYGTSATNFLGDPDRWLSINVLGAVYKVPLYI